MDPMLYVLQVLANAQARIGDLDEAIKTLGTISASGFGKYMRNQTIAQIVGTRLGAGDLVGARRVAELLPDDENPYSSDSTEKPALLERIATQQAEKGNPAEVLKWVQNQKSPNYKLRMLRGLALGIAERVAPQKKKTAESPTKIKTPH
jgi:hypothetical protein